MRAHPAVLLFGLILATVAPVSSLGRQKQRPAPFIVFATIFDERGFAFPGAKARLRRAGEKKARAEAQSDRRGEFAMRVPSGEEYELIVSARGYRPITQTVDARQTNRVDLTLHLVPASKEMRKGEEPAKDKPAGERPSRELHP